MPDSERHSQLSVVIPVYKARDCLAELHRRLVAALEPITPDFELVLVEDGGDDGSWEEIVGLARHDLRVKGFKLSRNFGQHHAITAGLDQVTGDWTVVMDCDLQDKPEDIHRLLEKAEEGFDVVIARRATRRDPLAKRITARVFYATFSWFAGYRFDSGIRSFRVMSRVATTALRSMREQMRSLAPHGAWLGFDTAYVDVDHGDRLAGSSSYSWSKLAQLATSNIIAFSDRPLRMSIGVGFVMSGCAFLYGAFIFLKAFFQGIPVPGWSSLITSLYFIGGLILANLGVIGVYLAKTFDEAKRRPLYVIAKTTAQESPAVHAASAASRDSAQMQERPTRDDKN